MNLGVLMDSPKLIVATGITKDGVAISAIKTS